MNTDNQSGTNTTGEKKIDTTSETKPADTSDKKVYTTKSEIQPFPIYPTPTVAENPNMASVKTEPAKEGQTSAGPQNIPEETKKPNIKQNSEDLLSHQEREKIANEIYKLVERNKKKMKLTPAEKNLEKANAVANTVLNGNLIFNLKVDPNKPSLVLECTNFKGQFAQMKEAMQAAKRIGKLNKLNLRRMRNKRMAEKALAPSAVSEGGVRPRAVRAAIAIKQRNESQTRSGSRRSVARRRKTPSRRSVRGRPRKARRARSRSKKNMSPASN